MITKKNVICAGLIFLLSAALLFGCDRAVFSQRDDSFEAIDGKTIVIDAGHGGFDGGAEGKGGIVEKDINIAIAKKLKKLLEDSGAFVIMTREGDEPVAHTKYEDMELREEIIRKSGCFAMISIHQNIYQDSSVCGAQVFYYSDKTQANSLAVSVQKYLNEMDGAGKKRKAHTGDYKMLRAGNNPGIIVECGFLSNWEDTQKLSDEKYQQNIAEAIIKGLAEFCEKHNEIKV